MMSALEPRDRPAAMEYTAPVPGVATPRGWSAKGEFAEEPRSLVESMLRNLLRLAEISLVVDLRRTPTTYRD